MIKNRNNQMIEIMRFIACVVILVADLMSCHSLALTRCHKLIHFPVIDCCISGAFAPDFYSALLSISTSHAPPHNGPCVHRSAVSSVGSHTSGSFHRSC